jgi:hypothetical protein
MSVTMRRQWAMSSAVSPYGTRNTSSFPRMISQGHRLLLVAVHVSSKVHMSSKDHRHLLVAVHMSRKVHTYMRGTPTRVHHLDILSVRKYPLSGTVRRLGRDLEKRKPSRLFRSYLGKKLSRNASKSLSPRWKPIW